MSRIIRIIRSKSLRYILFRSKYELERKSGLLALKFPKRPRKVNLPSLQEWRLSNRRYIIADRETLLIPKVPSGSLREDTRRILNGEVRFFSDKWYSLGLEYDWVTNPLNGYRYDIKQHWTKVNDYSKDAGDIKFVWEPSRFCWFYTIIRNDYHNDEDHSEFVLNRILDWIEKNPLNCGPNYKCSQETSIRVLNWLFALNFYKNSPNLTEEAWSKIVLSIYWQVHHVYTNINFSRIAVRNNHAITETLTLYLVGLVFPTFPGATKWKEKGKHWFEEEIDYQIEEDGTFIQDSMNYHRVVIQLLTYAIAISDKNGEVFDDDVYEKAYKSLNFLFQCQEPTNGKLPNYGANDGALFFPLSTADYRDYRPQLDALHGLLTGEPLYDRWLEDAQWVGSDIPSTRKPYERLEKQYGLLSFDKSGYYLIREKETLTFIRCGLFKTNGSNDQLHIDVWYKGENVLMDGGSYLYNTDEGTLRYFAGTESHNTIMIEDNGQMNKGPRFMWFNPPTVNKAGLREEYLGFVFEGSITAYKQVCENGVTINRLIKKVRGTPEWEIIDTIEGVPEGLTKRQLWHTRDKSISLTSDGEERVVTGWFSDYYGSKDESRQVEFSSIEKVIKTKIILSE